MNNLLKSVLKSEAIIALLIGSSVLWILLSIYSNFSIPVSLLLSILYISCVVIGTFLYKYSLNYIKVSGRQFRIVLIFSTLTVPLLITFVICILTNIISIEQFAKIIPLLIVFGAMFFILLILWNKQSQLKKEIEEKEEKVEYVEEYFKEKEENIKDIVEYGKEIVEKSEKIAAEKEVEKPELQSKVIENKKNKQEKIDKISVKQGTEINILKADEIYYIESYGDYVLIYTEKSKFIKEQTMYHFASVLPQHFIRIHRSYIINSDYMTRLELFGKETYNIRLKNGVSLKASKSGYKLLKEKLDL
jgi:DNA-binding LytR/AlgR family response regulator